MGVANVWRTLSGRRERERERENGPNKFHARGLEMPAYVYAYYGKYRVGFKNLLNAQITSLKIPFK